MAVPAARHQSSLALLFRAGRLTPGWWIPASSDAKPSTPCTWLCPTFISPRGRPDPTYVHMDTWLWVGAAQFEPLAKTVTAGGTTVTVTAEPIQVWWDLGDGHRVVLRFGWPWRGSLTWGRVRQRTALTCTRRPLLRNRAPGTRCGRRSTTRPAGLARGLVCGRLGPWGPLRGLPPRSALRCESGRALWWGSDDDHRARTTSSPAVLSSRPRAASARKAPKRSAGLITLAALLVVGFGLGNRGSS